ncbi:nitrilase-related carbon-nitrogen hydrolase [Terrarubrum flagellatum]|uniref:nitrilase-related carbon-nitrogen hydrolase n=1 Tax=Terrirubrum flagellatum TaxID=2895980 RepID=UPI003144FBFB
MSFLAAAIQLGPASDTIAKTADRIVALVDEVGGRGVKLAALPELALTPYFAAKVQDVDCYFLREENEAAMARIAAAAKASGIALSLPFAELAGDSFYNSMAFLDEQGRRLGLFRKVHIPGQREPKPEGAFTILEKRYFTPGDLGFGVFATRSAKIGGLICYDRRFPESYRALGLAGAEVILVGYNTPATPPTTLAKARRMSELAMRGGAYSTASYVIGAGKAGREDGARFIGGSLVIGPDGEILARAKTEGDELVVAEIELAKVEALRKRWNYEENRRPEVYAAVAAPESAAA